MSLKELPQAASGYVWIGEKAVIRITGGRDESRKKGGSESSDWRVQDQFGRVYLLITPPPPYSRSIGIIGLGEIRDLIYELQSLRGKILSHKELQLQIGSQWSALVSGPGISQSRSCEHAGSVENVRFREPAEDDEAAAIFRQSAHDRH
jgi:hypothetical protein